MAPQLSVDSVLRANTDRECAVYLWCYSRHTHCIAAAQSRQLFGVAAAVLQTKDVVEQPHCGHRV